VYSLQDLPQTVIVIESPIIAYKLSGSILFPLSSSEILHFNKFPPLFDPPDDPPFEPPDDPPL